MNDIFGKKLGQYILLEQLGEGGMAKVYNAFDSRVERNVAIKVILPSKRTSKVFLQQFEREAKALANLTHTNIVKVLNYGIQDDHPYLVMEYVSGGTLKEAMNQKLPWQTAAAILAPIARALDYVHQQNIVHRDVKPSNILLQGDFSPMLSDFGILQILESKDEKVEAAIGAGVGTPEYMPPEQGMGKEVDFRADIYSLGLVFYEMVTGQKPYTADSPMAIVIKHVTEELPLPTRVDRNIPKFVERTILRAVQKNPKNRYMSMGHFAQALELIALGDKAPERKIIKVSKQKEKRQRSISIFSLAMLLILLTLGTALFTYNYFTTNGQSPAVTQPGILAVNIPTNTTTPTKSIPSTPTLTLTPFITQTLEALINPFSNLSLLHTPIAENRNAQFNEIARWGIGGVSVIEWSPDGKKMALGTTSGIFLYDSQTRELILFIDTQFNVVAMAFNPNAQEITAGSLTGITKTWNSNSGQFIQNYAFSRPPSNQSADSGAVTAISYSPDGKNIAVGYKKGAINYFVANQGNSILEVENYPAVEDLAISADNRFIYASNGSRDILIWNIQDGKKDRSTLANRTPVSNIRLSKDRQFMLAGGDGNSVYFWNLIESKQINSFPNPGNRITDFDFSYDGKYVAVGLSTGIINIFETPSLTEYSKTLVPFVSVNASSRQILSVAFSPNQLIVASGNHEEGLKLWDALNGQNTFTLDQSLRGINRLYLSADGLWLATAHEDGQLRIWDVNEAREVFKADGFLPKGNPFSPDNRFLVFIFSPGNNKPDRFHIFDLEQGKIVADFAGYLNEPLVQVHFTDDSKLLVMGNAYKASIWDVATWELVNSHGGPTAGCGQYFTPQNELLAIISNAGILFTNNQKIETMCGVKPPGATFVYYFYEQHKMLFVLGDGRLGIWGFSSDHVADFSSPAPYPLSSEIFLAGDQKSGWYAYVSEGLINIKNINGLAGTTIAGQNDYRYQVALLPEKNLLALGSKYGSIHIWTMP